MTFLLTLWLWMMFDYSTFVTLVLVLCLPALPFCEGKKDQCLATSPLTNVLLWCWLCLIYRYAGLLRLRACLFQIKLSEFTALEDNLCSQLEQFSLPPASPIGVAESFCRIYFLSHTDRFSFPLRIKRFKKWIRDTHKPVYSPVNTVYRLACCSLNYLLILSALSAQESSKQVSQG